MHIRSVLETLLGLRVWDSVAFGLRILALQRVVHTKKQLPSLNIRGSADAFSVEARTSVGPNLNALRVWMRRAWIHAKGKTHTHANANTGKKNTGFDRPRDQHSAILTKESNVSGGGLLHTYTYSIRWGNVCRLLNYNYDRDGHIVNACMQIRFFGSFVVGGCREKFKKKSSRTTKHLLHSQMSAWK